MGCWDIFCLLCGNPCHGPIYSKQDLLSDIEYYNNSKKKNL